MYRSQSHNLSPHKLIEPENKDPTRTYRVGEGVRVGLSRLGNRGDLNGLR